MACNVTVRWWSLLAALLAVALGSLGIAPAWPARAVGSVRAFAVPLSAGGAFTATTAGIFTFLGCPAGLGCTLILTGGGPATFLGQSDETTVMRVTGLNLPCGQVAGSSVLTSTVTPGDAVTASFTGTLCIRIPPIRGLAFALTYTFTGGRGAYSGASGSGTITGAVAFNRTYRDAWKGTVFYP